MSEVVEGFDVIETLEKIHKEIPEHLGVLIEITSYHRGRYNLDKAAKYGKIALKLAPENPQLNKIMGAVELYKSNYEVGLKYHQKAIGNIDYSEDELNEVAWNFQKLDMYNEAIEYYEMILQDNPNNLTTLINAGYCYGHMENTAKALEYSERALQVSPNQSTALLNTGFRHWVEHDLKKAKYYTERCISVAPNYNLAYMNLGHILLCEENKEEAFKNYEKSISLFYDWTEFYDYFWDDWKYMKTYRTEESTYKEIEQFCKKIWEAEREAEDDDTPF